MRAGATAQRSGRSQAENIQAEMRMTYVEVSERSYKCIETGQLYEVLWPGPASLKGILPVEKNP